MIEGRAGGARVLRGVREAFELTIYVDAKETDADSLPTVTVVRANGAAVATAAATTKPASTTGLYRWTPAQPDVAEVERYTATWSVTLSGVAHSFVTYHEIVGAFYCDLQALRAQEGLEDLARFPDARLVDARRWFEDLAERFCKRAFVLRYEREIHSGDGGTILQLERRPARRLLAVSIGATALTVADLDLERSGRLSYEGGFALGESNVAISYVHGDDEPDGELRDAAVEAIADRVRRSISGVSERSLSMTTGEGTFNLSIAGPDRPTGLPSVDQVLRTRRGSAVVVR